MTASGILVRGLAVALALFKVNTVAAQYGEIMSTAADPDTPEFNVLGFGDVSYVSRDGSSEDGFVIGQAVAHLSASLGNSFSVFGEISATGRDSEYSLEVERMIVKYEFSDLLKLSAGRYHSPIGYWNSAFHHGAWLQTTTSRPEVAKFGSRIIPIHFVGLLAEGTWTQSKLGLSYELGFGNGRHANIARAGDAGDINGDKAWMVQLRAAPDALGGVKLGLGYYSDEVQPDGALPSEESTVSAYVAWSQESPEVIVEYLHSEHELVSDSSVNGDVDAWYAQFAYRLGDELGDWKPYARYERTEVDNSDPLLGADGLDYEGSILGVRWDFNAYGALKFEYRNEEFDNAGRENNYRVQLSFVLAKL